MTNAEIAEEAGEALQRHVLEPLASRSVDRGPGGILAEDDDRGRPHDTPLEHAARTTIALALLDRARPGEGYDALARHGCAFLQTAWDETYGGFFAGVDRAGAPLWDGLKHPHAATSAAQAFLAAGHVLPSGEGDAWAARALAWLEDVARDPVHGGYWGAFRRTNERYPEGTRLPTPDGLDALGTGPGVKEIDTLGDSIEMLALFCEGGAVTDALAARCAARLAQLVELVVDQLVDAGGALPYLYRPDWRPVPGRTSVGHQFVMARHLVRGARVLEAEAKLVARSADMVDFCLQAARRPAGGFCIAVAPDGGRWPATAETSDLRPWWVQIEALHTLHLLAGHEAIGRADRIRYWQARDEQWAFVRSALSDEEYRGIRTLALDPTPRWTRRLVEWLRGPSSSGPPLRMRGWHDLLPEVATFLAIAARP